MPQIIPLPTLTWVRMWYRESIPLVFTCARFVWHGNKACGPIIGTSNLKYNFDGWIRLGIASYSCQLQIDAKCQFKLQEQSWDFNAIRCQSEDPSPPSRYSQLCSELSLDQCMCFEHIVQYYCNMCFFSVHSQLQILPYTTLGDHIKKSGHKRTTHHRVILH